MDENSPTLYVQDNGFLAKFVLRFKSCLAQRPDFEGRLRTALGEKKAFLTLANEFSFQYVRCSSSSRFICAGPKQAFVLEAEASVQAEDVATTVNNMPTWVLSGRTDNLWSVQRA